MSTQKELAAQATAQIIKEYNDIRMGEDWDLKDVIPPIILSILRRAVDEYSADNVKRKCRDILQALRIENHGQSWLDVIDATHKAQHHISGLESQVRCMSTEGVKLQRIETGLPIMKVVGVYTTDGATEVLNRAIGCKESEFVKLEHELQAARAEIATDDTLLEGRKRLLEAIPECPDHGPCIPHAEDWIEKAKNDITRMDHLESEEVNDSVRSLFRKNKPITRGTVDTRIREVVDERS